MSLRNVGPSIGLVICSLWFFAAQSDDQVPASKAPVQRKTKEAAPKKAVAARKPAASKKKAAGIKTGLLSLTGDSSVWFIF